MNREELVILNLHAVEDIIPEFSGRGIDDDELRQDGSLGLCVASQRTAAEFTEVQFARFARFWIRSAMRRACAATDLIARKRSGVRFPMRVAADLRAVVAPTPIAADDLRILVIAALECLSKTQRRIVVAIFGLEGGRRLAVAAIGRANHLSRYKILLIRAAAMKLLKAHLLEDGVSSADADEWFARKTA